MLGEIVLTGNQALLFLALFLGVMPITCYAIGYWLMQKFGGAPTKKDIQELQDFAQKHSK